MIKKKSFLISQIKNESIEKLKVSLFLPLNKTWNYEYILKEKQIIEFLKNNILNEEFINIRDDIIYNKIYDGIDVIDIPNTIFLNFIQKNKREYFPKIYLADFNHFEYVIYLISQMNSEKINKLFDLVNIFYLFENYKYLKQSNLKGCLNCNENIDIKNLIPNTIMETLGGGEELNYDYKNELLDKIIFKAITTRDDE